MEWRCGRRRHHPPRRRKQNETERKGRTSHGEPNILFSVARPPAAGLCAFRLRRRGGAAGGNLRLCPVGTERPLFSGRGQRRVYRGPLVQPGNIHPGYLLQSALPSATGRDPLPRAAGTAPGYPAELTQRPGHAGATCHRQLDDIRHLPLSGYLPAIGGRAGPGRLRNVSFHGCRAPEWGRIFLPQPIRPGAFSPISPGAVPEKPVLYPMRRCPAGPV